MALTLYNAPASTCSQRVRFVLNAKGLDFAEVKLDLIAGDQLRPEYLKLNPNGVVPTLVHGEDVIIDSAVIMQYLEEVFPYPASFTPSTPASRAKMRALLHFIDEMPAAAVRVPTYNLVFLPHFAAMGDEEFRRVADSKPLRREFLLGLGRTGFTDEEMAVALGRLMRTYERMEAIILASGGPWLMGSAMTLADISLMPALVRMADLGYGPAWRDKPLVRRWYESIRAHPAYAATYYPGSFLSEQYPHFLERRSEAHDMGRAASSVWPPA